MCALLCAWTVSAANAGEWLIVPSVSSALNITDNVRGVTHAQGRESDVFNRTTAGVGVTGTGARAKLRFNYGLSRDTFMDNEDLDASSQNFSGIGDVELWEDHLFVNARAALSQQTLTRLGANSAGERTLTENQTQVLTYSLGPRFRRRYASWAD